MEDEACTQQLAIVTLPTYYPLPHFAHGQKDSLICLVCQDGTSPLNPRDPAPGRASLPLGHLARASCYTCSILFNHFNVVFICFQFLISYYTGFNMLQHIHIMYLLFYISYLFSNILPFRISFYWNWDLCKADLAIRQQALHRSWRLVIQPSPTVFALLFLEMGPQRHGFQILKLKHQI